jgi:hypothetical protein
LNKNTRWALALVGVVILIVAAIFVTKDDSTTDATQTQTPTESTSNPSAGGTGATGAPNSGGATSGGNGGNSGGATSGSGGSSPDNGTGGASPDDTGTGGAKVSSEQGPLLVAGKVVKISVKQGDTVYVRAKSVKADELHIHGYDLKVDLPAGKTVSYKFKADIGGSFEMEFENEGLQVAALKVNP